MLRTSLRNSRLRYVTSTRSHGAASISGLSDALSSLFGVRQANGNEKATVVDPLSQVSSERFPLAFSSDVSNAAAKVSEATSEYTTVLEGTGFTSFWASLINDVHVMADVPYWQAILLVTMGVRAINVPLFMRSVGSGARMKKIMPHIQQIMDQFAAARSRGDMPAAQEWFKKRAALMKEHKVGLLRAFVPILVQMPLAIGIIWALRELSIDAAHIPQFMNGGVAWFPRLDIPDPTYALPVATAASGILSSYLNPNKQGLVQLGLTADKMKRFGMMFSLMFGVISTQFPAGTQIYFCATTSTMLVQQMLLRSSIIKKISGIPPEWPDVEPIPLPGQTPEEARRMMNDYEDKQNERLMSNPIFKKMRESLGDPNVASPSAFRAANTENLTQSNSTKSADSQYVTWKGLTNAGPPPPPSTPHPSEGPQANGTASPAGNSVLLTAEELARRRQAKPLSKKTKRSRRK